MSPLRNEGKENQASRAGFSIKHVVIDTRKPEMKKATQLHDLNENNNDLLCVLFCKRLNGSWHASDYNPYCSILSIAQALPRILLCKTVSNHINNTRNCLFLAIYRRSNYGCQQ